MMKKIAFVIVLLALCIPTLAVDMPNMVGNWTGSYEGVGFENITSSNPDGNLTFFKIGETTWTISIEEQNGAGFVGEKSSTTNPVMQKLVGIIGFDNKTISMADETGYYLGEMISPAEMQLLHYENGKDGMAAVRSTITKE